MTPDTPIHYDQRVCELCAAGIKHISTPMQCEFCGARALVSINEHWLCRSHIEAGVRMMLVSQLSAQGYEGEVTDAHVRELVEIIMRGPDAPHT